jgi:hypothetical protein
MSGLSVTSRRSQWVLLFGTPTRNALIKGVLLLDIGHGSPRLIQHFR